jgi:hypothetical protein
LNNRACSIRGSGRALVSLIREEREEYAKVVVWLLASVTDVWLPAGSWAKAVTLPRASVWLIREEREEYAKVVVWFRASVVEACRPSAS